MLLAGLKVHGMIDKTLSVRVKPSKQVNQKILFPINVPYHCLIAIYQENPFQCYRIEVTKGEVPRHCYTANSI